MSKFLNSGSVLILFVLGVCNSSCSSNSGTSTKTASKDTTAVTSWVNPRKGKIWEKENIVKIPLTALESQLAGQVKSVTYREYEYSETEGDSSKELVDSGYNVYDKAGHLVDQNEFYADKTPKWHCLYKYDNNYKPQEWDLNIYDDDLNTQTTFKYDGRGNKTEEVTADSTGKPMGRTAYKYDDKGNELEADIYDMVGKLKQILSYQYDRRGFQISYSEKSPDGEVFSKLTCAYDDNGNKTGGADYSSDTDMENKWVQKNDAMGRRTETDYFLPDDELLERRTITYDAQGFPVEYITYKKDGSMQEEKSYSYKNEYDKTGNIIRQTEIRWKGGKRIPVTYAEYMVTYY
jgi:YD repeat-containing protein